MSFKSIISSVAVSAIAAGSLIPLSSAASAGEWNHRGHGQRFESHAFDNHGGNRGWNQHRQYNAWHGSNDYDGNYGYRRHRNNNGRALAIGAFATILGIAIAAEASRGHNDHYVDRD